MSSRLRRSILATLALSAAFGSAAVVVARPLPAPITATPTIPRLDSSEAIAASDGADLFAQNCVACHGASGAGDGPAAPGLNPKPRALSSKSVMSKISDAQIMKVIKTGGAANKLSPVMPAFAHFSDDQVKALVAHIRGLCGCSFAP